MGDEAAGVRGHTQKVEDHRNPVINKPARKTQKQLKKKKKEKSEYCLSVHLLLEAIALESVWIQKSLHVRHAVKALCLASHQAASHQRSPLFGFYAALPFFSGLFFGFGLVWLGAMQTLVLGAGAGHTAFEPFMDILSLTVKASIHRMT